MFPENSWEGPNGKNVHTWQIAGKSTDLAMLDPADGDQKGRTAALSETSGSQDAQDTMRSPKGGRGKSKTDLALVREGLKE